MVRACLTHSYVRSADVHRSRPHESSASPSGFRVHASPPNDRDCIHVTDAKGETRTAKEWGTSTDHAKMLEDVRVNKERQPIPAIVTVHAKA